MFAVKMKVQKAQMTTSRRPRRAHRQKGKAATATATAQIPPRFDVDKIRQLYSTMLGCRMAAERAHRLLEQDKLPGDLGIAAGQEAANVGTLIDLLADDCVGVGRHDLTTRFIRAIPLKTIFADLYARRAGARDGFAGPQAGGRAPEAMIAPTFALSAQLNLVTGVAWSLKRHGRPNVAVAFSEDDSTSLACWRDCVTFSALHKLPIVHVVSANAGDSSVREILHFAAEHASARRPQPSLPAFTVDGNDVVAVYRVAQEAIRRARQGYGPAVIECQVSRGRSHPDAKSPNLGLDTLEAADPIARMETYLQQQGMWSDKWKRKLVENFSRKLDHAVDFAEKSLQQRRKRMKSKLATAS
jgi:pyruvate dehydrogenase E1 component alpha subunit